MLLDLKCWKAIVLNELCFEKWLFYQGAFMLLGTNKLPESQAVLGLSSEVKLKGLGFHVVAVTRAKLIPVFLQG